jgi:hypothetical protein
VYDFTHLCPLLRGVTFAAPERNEQQESGGASGEVLGVVAGARPRFLGRDPECGCYLQRCVDQVAVECHRIAGAEWAHGPLHLPGASELLHSSVNRGFDPRERIERYTSHIDP